MVGFMRRAAGIGLLLSANAAGLQETDPKLDLIVASIRREEREFRVTLRGEVDARDGDLLVVRLSPLVFRAVGEPPALVLCASETGTTARQVRVQKGVFEVSFGASRLLAQEVAVTFAASSRAPLRARLLNLFDPESAEERHLKEAESFARQLSVVREFVAGLEPHAKSEGGTAPEALHQRLQEIEMEVFRWFQTTEFTAAGPYLTQVVTDLQAEVPWVDASGARLRGRDYRRSPEDRRMPDLEELKRRLRLAEETAVREEALRILAPLTKSFLAAVAEHGFKRAERSVRVSCSLLRSLESGAMAETARAYAPIKELLPIVSEVDEKIRTLSSASVPPDADALRCLKALGDGLVKAAESISRSTDAR